MRRLLAVLVVLGTSCAYDFDSNKPDITLVGSAPNTDGLPRLNQNPAGYDYVVYGADHSYWVAFTETSGLGNDNPNSVRVVRLSDPVQDEVMMADNVVIRYTEFYLLQHDAQDPANGPITLTVRSAGQTAPPSVFTLSAKPGVLDIAYSDNVFFYWILDPTTTTYLLQRVDQTYMRTLPVPTGVDPTNPYATLTVGWSGDGSRMFLQDATNHIVLHSTTSELDVDLGAQPPTWFVYDGISAVVTCGDDGLKTVGYDGKSVRVLDPSPCDGNGSLYPRNGSIFYGVGEELRRVLPDGSQPPVVVFEGGQRVLSISGDSSKIIYSRDPSNRYIFGAGDGWVDDWRFMNRGLGASFSGDGTRVRWLENAADSEGAGELHSAPLTPHLPPPDGGFGDGGVPDMAGTTELPALKLSLNTRQYEELPDGRILCDADHAFRGEQNRIEVIDERQRTARWVASAAAQYDHVPGTSDLLIDVVSSPIGFDIVRVPLPPPVAVDGGTP